MCSVGLIGNGGGVGVSVAYLSFSSAQKGKTKGI